MASADAAIGGGADDGGPVLGDHDDHDIDGSSRFEADYFRGLTDATITAGRSTGVAGEGWRGSLPSLPSDADDHSTHVDVMGAGLAGSTSLLPLRIDGLPAAPRPPGAASSLASEAGEEAREGSARPPGLRRMMNRLMFRTMASCEFFPPSLHADGTGRLRGRRTNGEYDDDDEDEDDVGLFDFFGLLDATTFSRPVDVRRPDRLVCPTCMRVHLPVDGTERIRIPAEEEEEEGEGDGDAARDAAGAANDGEEEARVDQDQAEDYDAADVVGPDNAIAWVLTAHREYVGSEDVS
jgi:hypothetical protein